MAHTWRLPPSGTAGDAVEGLPTSVADRTPVSGYTRCSLPGGLCRPRFLKASWFLFLAEQPGEEPGLLGRRPASRWPLGHVMPMTVTAGSVVVVPMIVMAIMIVVGVMAFLSAVIVTLMVSMVMAFMIFVVVALVFVVGFRQILLRLFIEGHFAARRAEVVGPVIVFTLTARRVVCIHIHLANWVNRCSHSISSD